MKIIIDGEENKLETKSNIFLRFLKKFKINLYTEKAVEEIVDKISHNISMEMSKIIKNTPFDDNSTNFYQNVSPIGYGLKENISKNTKESVNAYDLGYGTSIHGDIQRNLTSAYLNKARSSSFMFYDTTPIGRAYVKSLLNYVYGRGLKAVTQSPEVNDVIEKFWDFNNLEKRQKNLYKMHILNGESFIALVDTIEKMGTLSVRYIPPQQITEIITNEDDIYDIYGFKRDIIENNRKSIFYRATFYEDTDAPLELNKRISDCEIDKSTAIAFLKNGHEDELRGLPYMFPAFRWMRIALEYGLDRARFANFRHRIYGIVSVQKGYSSGSIPATKSLPNTGNILVENMNQKFRFESPNVGGTDVRNDWTMLMYLVCSGLQTPPHILFQDSSNENYASIRKADTPYANLILDEQDEMRDFWKYILQYLLKIMVEKGKLPKTVKIKRYGASMTKELSKESAQDAAINTILENLKNKKGKMLTEKEVKDLTKNVSNKLGGEYIETINTVDIPIDVIFPHVVWADPLQTAQLTRILVITGLMSRYTARRKLDLNPEEEAARISTEKEFITKDGSDTKLNSDNEYDKTINKNEKDLLNPNI